MLSFLAPVLVWLLAACGIWIAAVLIHEGLNKGLSPSSRHQQGFRFAVAAVLAVLPWAVSGATPCGPRFWMAVAVSAVWAVTYPLLFHLSSRRSSPDYDNYMDSAVACYMFGALSALGILAASCGTAVGIIAATVAAVVEFLMLAICAAQWIYYFLYKKCIDNAGMVILEQTHVNEVFEFSRSYPWYLSILPPIAFIALAWVCAWANLSGEYGADYQPVWVVIAEAVIFVALVVLTFNGRRSPFSRSGIIRLYLDVREYTHSTEDYEAHCRERVKDLEVEPLGKPWTKPSTIVMVIGESATRDFMSAFVKMEHDTTPWMRQSAESDPQHFMLYPHIYSCALFTVASLERALTEFNQYNGKDFNSACTVIDIARALGYKVHWYSNQGHLGAFDTRVTLMANTSDVAKWTKQQLNRPQYDMTMLDFIDELDPNVNNLLVFHLKGSHFNFLNRFPAECTVWGNRNPHDDETNYLNTLRYTDGFLHEVFERCRARLNMQAMVYFSDHGCIPSQRRKPGFDGFNNVRIPLMVWLSDEYRRLHPERYEALQANRDRYFTNDFVYELMCGIFDIRSAHFNEADSLASTQYAHTPADLTTDEGRISLTTDV